MAFHKLDNLINLHDGYRRVFQVAGLSLLLVQQGESRWLIRNRCPHKDFPLHTGTLEGSRLRCRYHGMEFDLAAGGRCLQFPRQPCVEMFPLVFRGNEIGVDLPGT